jgi:uncharacterized protein (TIGR02246 family)
VLLGRPRAPDGDARHENRQELMRSSAHSRLSKEAQMPTARSDYQVEVQKAITVWENAAKAKDADTIASLYVEDATLLPPGAPPVKGRQNIRDFWKAFLDAGATEPVLRSASIEGAGDLAYEIGEYQVTMPNPQGGGTATQHGKYLVVWKRQSDGSLKMAADMFSSNA